MAIPLSGRLILFEPALGGRRALLIKLS